MMAHQGPGRADARRRLVTTFAIVAVAFTLLAMAPGAEAQCAMCRTMLATPEGQKMIGALRSGILLLLAAPFAVFATIATLAVRAQRRRQATESLPPTAPPDAA